MHRFLKFFLPAIWLLFLAAAPAWGDEVMNRTTTAFVDTVATNFSAWDVNHDRILSVEELDTAIEDPANKGPAAAALVTLRHAISVTNLPPLTLANIHKLADDKNLKLRGYYNQSMGRIKRVTHRELFVSGLPQLSTIHQGRMGNCFCLAPLGAMIYRDPHEVASWFEVQSNGEVLVKMAAGAVAVPPPTDAELGFESGNSEDGVWVNLYEKAIGEARNERKPPGKRFEIALDAIAKGGSEGQILSYITGHKVSFFSLRSERNTGNPEVEMAQLRQKLEFAISNKLLVVCGTQPVSTPGLTPKHAYALLNYDAGSDAVTLWNPHGNNFKPKGPPGVTNGFPTTNGIFTLALTDLTNQFHHVVFELPATTPLKWPDQWELLAEAGHFPEAAADLMEVIDSDESEDWRLYMLTPLLAQAGRVGDYTNHCKVMLNEYEKTRNPSIAERTAKSCLLLPLAVGPDDLTRASNLAARAVALSPNGAWLHWRLMTRGLAEYRTGRYEDALKTEAEAAKVAMTAPDMNAPACAADAYFISAMAHEKLKQKYRAQGDLKRGLKIVQEKLPTLDSGDLGEGWFDTLMANIIMREAKGT